jgi:hypothetical protein
MRPDSEIKRDVEGELRWEPNVDPTDIAVAVKNGVVTLTGFVRSYAEKFAGERAAKRVKGVVGVANDLEVRLPQTDERPDPEIARDVVANLKMPCRCAAAFSISKCLYWPARLSAVRIPQRCAYSKSPYGNS